MTTDELNAIVQAVMTELEKAGVDFDFKAKTPQADDLVYVMRGSADKYQGITVTWQNLLDIIVQKATEARDEAISAKDIALQTLATIQGIESNVSSMKSSVETTKGEVETLKSDVATMKASVEGTKTEVEGLKSDVTTLKAQTQTIVDNAKEDVTGLLDTKVNYTDALTYEEIMATNPVPDLTNKVASASAVQAIGARIRTGYFRVTTNANTPVLVKDNKLDGTLPTSVNTYFTIVTNSSSISHTTTLFFDESNVDRLIVVSNVSQNIGVNWVSFY